MRAAQDLDYTGEPLRLPVLFPPAPADGAAPALPWAAGAWAALLAAALGLQLSACATSLC